jgi:hypothetical protein
MPDSEKRRRADFEVQSGLGRRHTLNRLKEIVRLMRGRRGTKWPSASPEKWGSHARSRS